MTTSKPLKAGDQMKTPPSSEFLSYGYSVYEMEKVPDKWKCVFCSGIIKEPVQFVECGDRSCRGCYESRLAASPNGKLICPGQECNVEFDKSQTMNDRAFKRELDKLEVTCIHKSDQHSCLWTGALYTYQEHLDANHIHFTCDECKESFSSVLALKEHREKSCPSLFQRCPLAPYCGTDMIRNDEFDAHLLSEKHQEALALALIGKYNAPETHDQEQDMDTTSAYNEQEKQTSEKLSELADKVQQLNDDTIKLSQDFVKLNELHQVASQEVTYLQAACTERNIIMSNLQPKQDAIQKDIEQIRQNLEENQQIATDGTLTWRIERVAEKMADAQSERQPSIFSPMFYSSPHGYKMRARLYLHGDGNARRTHMSLFFLLVKGEYDPLLAWPFSHKVTFCLFDQTGAGRHIIDSFRPDVKSSSFQRPVNENNIASGIPKFFPLPMIQQDDNPYVRDDTMFLKIMIDIHETPKVMLPFVLNLNPGLPTHVQHHLISQEKIKQQQQQA
ncbi:unnamed protein product [Adineta ricciae]|uniref:MATH domain-containing protein n=1 Tax=Adineta ricciae TaxID=249248 RepID=A0A814L952_ADIRI|nr:unnamed protein product [Adineta ricciae]CAF1378544.1 unnamed protein product [Adineta ricciae]